MDTDPPEKKCGSRNSVKICVFQLFSFSSYYCIAIIFAYRNVLEKPDRFCCSLTVSLIGLLDLLGSPPKVL
jgi:hypothetical protein